MKTKTIEKFITKKFNEFLESIKDERVKKLVKENSLITGGCIASMYLKEKINDYDIYFTNKETVIAVCNYYVKIFNDKNLTNGIVIDGDEFQKSDKEIYNTGYTEELEIINQPGRVRIFFESAGMMKEKGLPEDTHELGDTIEVKEVEGELYRPIYLSSNSITLSGQIQIIIRFYGKAEEIHDNYDFVHCTNYWLSETENVTVNQKALECLLSKELFYIGSKYPLASIIRIRKFVSRGWKINAGQILKMCFQLSKLDLTDIKVLEDQLVGVDLQFFAQLIDCIKKEKMIEYNYLSTVIDKIF